MRQLTSLDAQFLAAEDGAVVGHVTGLAVYGPAADGRPLSREAVRDVVASRLHLVEPFRRRLVQVPFGLDLPYWVEDDAFDLDDHVRGHELPGPGDDRELAAYVGELMATPLDLRKPPWAIEVISGLSGGRTAVATRIHHSASDGLAMAELFAIMHAATPDSGSVVGPVDLDPDLDRVARRERVPSPAEMLVRGALGVPRQPLRFARSLPRALPHLDQVVTLRGLPGVPTVSALARRVQRALGQGQDGQPLPGPAMLAPRTRTSGRVSASRAAAFTTTSLPEVKAIKNAFGVSVNDVVMAIVAGALRTWLADHDDLPDEPLAAMVPVSVRDPAQSGAFGNRIVMMIPPVPSNEPDPLRRLQLTHAAMVDAKVRHGAVPGTLLQDANHLIPPILLARAAQATAVVGTSPRRARTAVNLLMSNIPGAREPQHLAGAPLIAHFPLSAIFHGIGLNVTVVSYQDQLDWGVALDPEQIDDAWGLIGALEQAQAELFATAGVVDA